jgi:hypothetical protein
VVRPRPGGAAGSEPDELGLSSALQPGDLDNSKFLHHEVVPISNQKPAEKLDLQISRMIVLAAPPSFACRMGAQLFKGLQ